MEAAGDCQAFSRILVVAHRFTYVPMPLVAIVSLDKDKTLRFLPFCIE
jgi:hypothetical protein